MKGIGRKKSVQINGKKTSKKVFGILLLFFKEILFASFIKSINKFNNKNVLYS